MLGDIVLGHGHEYITKTDGVTILLNDVKFLNAVCRAQDNFKLYLPIPCPIIRQGWGIWVRPYLAFFSVLSERESLIEEDRLRKARQQGERELYTVLRGGPWISLASKQCSNKLLQLSHWALSFTNVLSLLSFPLQMYVHFSMKPVSFIQHGFASNQGPSKIHFWLLCISARSYTQFLL